MTAPHWLRVQLSGPRGWLARPMARFLNRFNSNDYQRAMGELGAMPGETVLELGFGGGIGVETLLKKNVRVIAAEPAVAMRERAFRRWSSALAEGALEVWPHAAEQLPERRVDRALSMNTVYFWQDVEAGFNNLRRMVTTRLVLGIASPAHLHEAGFAEEGYRVKPVEWYQQCLAVAGFATSIVAAPDKDSVALLIGHPC